ncbi:MAG TPA: septum formation family protein [Candidatus Limnocylindrales bacterium]|jgi:hypothetical protein|nr:septum formation family protein [Candidatus Limnocylindrales bacterium]
MTDQTPLPPAQGPEAPPVAPPLLNNPPPPIAPPEPPPAGQWAAPPPTAKPASKLRTSIVGAIVLALVAVGAYYISQNQSADDLVVGQCFDEPNTSVDITTVVKHACTDAHDAEVFDVVEYSEGDTYPISSSVDSFIEEQCIPAFETYVGVAYADSADYSLGYFYPDATGWSKGDRTFTCYITREDDAKLTQSVKGAASS